ncbi:MAG: hypothetical protein R3C61_25325 [Bacteroidia bacterium]
MRITLHFLCLLTGIALLAGCKSTKSLPASSEDFHEKGMRIVQGKSVFHLDDEYNAVPLSKATFSIQFQNTPYDPDKNLYGAAQIVAFSRSKDMTEVSSGIPVSNIPFYEPGTGLAGPYDGGYLFVDEPNGHHYIFYSTSASEPTRCDLLGNGPGNLLNLSYTVNNLDFQGKMMSVKKWKSDYLYLVIFIDRNSNKIVDKGEFARVAIRFS